jgi:uracil-DNA glycosylase family 4
MIIHVTGMDATGKSTLCEKLVEEYKGQYTHFSNPKNKKEAKKQYFDFLNDIDRLKTYICDRYHDGEWVYAPIYRGYVADYLEEIENEILNHEVFGHDYCLVFTTAQLQTILNRIKVRGEDFVKEEHYQIVIDNFVNNYLMEQKLPFTIIDTTNKDQDATFAQAKEDIDKVIEIWKKIKLCATMWQYCPNTSLPMALPRGNIRAKYMVVGQNPGGRGKKKEYFVPMWSGKGATCDFFINALKEAGIYLDCWFTNAVLCSTTDNKITDEQFKQCDEHLKYQINTIKPEKIFTLGKVATKYTKEVAGDIEVIEVPHPTFIKRFYSGNPEKIQEYKNLFKVRK